MKDSLVALSKTLKLIFSKPAYIFIALVSGLVIFLLVALMPNFSLLTYVARETVFNWQTKLAFYWSFIVAPPNLTSWSLILVLVVSILFGVNLASLVYYFRRQIFSYQLLGSSLFGAVIGVLGIGCAACGSVILTTIFGLSATTILVSVLPFQGVELGVAGIAILLLSLYLTLNKINKGLTC